MVAAGESPLVLGRPDDESRARPAGRLPPRSLVLVAAAAAAAPALVATLAVVAADWYPSSDLALEALRVHDVGGADTPLVGVWSRWGYSHPGPWMLWALAPLERLMGSTGLLVGAGVLNATACAGAVLAAGRGAADRDDEGHNGSRPATRAAVVALATLALCASLGLALLVNPWNPWLATLPFWAFIVLLWRAAVGDRWMWPLALLVGSFVVQTHISYLPLVAALAIAAAAIALLPSVAGRSSRRDGVGADTPTPASAPEPLRAGRGPLLVSVVVAVVMWAPPVLQQLTGSPGNLGEILEFVTSPPGSQWGWSAALGIAGHQLGADVPWIAGSAAGAAGPTAQGAPWLAVAVAVALVALTTVLVRRGRRSAAGAVVLAAVGVVAGIVATAQMTGERLTYVVLWWRPVAAFTAVAVVLGAIALADGRWYRRIAAPTAAVTVVGAVVVTVAGLPVDVPDPAVSGSLSRLVPQVRDAVTRGSTYLVEGVEHRFATAGPGLVAGLRDAEVTVVVPDDDLAELQYGEHRVGGPVDADARLIVVSEEVVDDGWEPPADAVQIAAHDPLTPAERDEMRSTLATIRDALGDPSRGPLVQQPTAGAAVRAGVDPAEVDRYLDLQDRSFAYRVYLAPATGDG